MQAIMLVADNGEQLPHFRKLMRQHFPEGVFHEMAGPNEFAVFNTQEERIYFEYYGGIDAIGWEEDELNFIKQYFPQERHVYSLSYRGIEFIKHSLQLIANTPTYLIDNDCYTLLPGQEFALKIRQNPGWKWLRDFST